jgi:hypothetical protein
MRFGMVQTYAPATSNIRCSAVGRVDIAFGDGAYTTFALTR